MVCAATLAMTLKHLYDPLVKPSSIIPPRDREEQSDRFSINSLESVTIPSSLNVDMITLLE